MTTTTLFIDERVERAQHMFQTIQVWPHWDEIGLCAQKEYGLSSTQFQMLLPEYQRFMALCAVYPGIGMTSEAVDRIWLCHILHTSLYGTFCEPIIGHQIHHLPCSSYALYGVDFSAADDDCTTCKLPSIPTTCYGKLLPDEAQAETRDSISGGGQRFRDAYMAVFGELPAIWARVPRSQLVEGIAI
jgi:hypothetical protein